MLLFFYITAKSILTVCNQTNDCPRVYEFLYNCHESNTHSSHRTGWVHQEHYCKRGCEPHLTTPKFPPYGQHQLTPWALLGYHSGWQRNNISKIGGKTIIPSTNVIILNTTWFLRTAHTKTAWLGADGNTSAFQSQFIFYEVIKIGAI